MTDRTDDTIDDLVAERMRLMTEGSIFEMLVNVFADIYRNDLSQFDHDWMELDMDEKLRRENVIQINSQ